MGDFRWQISSGTGMLTHFVTMIFPISKNYEMIPDFASSKKLQEVHKLGFAPGHFVDKNS